MDTLFVCTHAFGSLLWLLVALQSDNLIHSNILPLYSPYSLISYRLRMSVPLLSSSTRLVQLRFVGIRVMASDFISSLLTG